MGVSSIGAVAK